MTYLLFIYNAHAMCMISSLGWSVWYAQRSSEEWRHQSESKGCTGAQSEYKKKNVLWIFVLYFLTLSYWSSGDLKTNLIDVNN